MSRKGIKLHRYSKKERSEHFLNWQTSGVSKASYCEAYQIKLGTFEYWCRLHKKYGTLTRPSKHQGKGKLEKASFVELKPSLEITKTSSLTPSPLLEIHYVNGVIIKTSKTDIEFIKELIYV